MKGENGAKVQGRKGAKGSKFKVGVEIKVKQILYQEIASSLRSSQ